MEDKKSVEKIVVTYDDGTTKDIGTGLVIQMKEVGEDITLSFDVAKLRGRDLSKIVFGVMKFGEELGCFGEEE